MNEENGVPQPKIVKDASNAFTYFVIIGALTCGLGLIIGGMISPLFIRYFFERSEINAKQDAEDFRIATGASEEKTRIYLAKNRGSRRLAIILCVVLWFIGSWALFIWLQFKGDYGLLRTY
jgi:hypothetical protein